MEMRDESAALLRQAGADARAAAHATDLEVFRQGMIDCLEALERIDPNDGPAQDMVRKVLEMFRPLLDRPGP